MRKKNVLLLACMFFLVHPRLFADIAAIHANALPQETTVLAALDDAREMEPYSHVWWPEWNFPLSKRDVAKHLDKDMGSLVHALKKHPENEELLLLTGLVGRYAYNVDVKGSQDTTLSALSQAVTLDPTDVRAPWFHATFLCETLQPAEGEDEFLSLEANHPWDQLAPAFWIDYMECASHTNMPAHVLRAVDYLEKLHAGEPSDFATVVDMNRKRFDPFDPKKAYEPKEIWQGENVGEDTVLTNTTCALRLRVHGSWGIDELEYGKSGCIAVFEIGPYKGANGNISPMLIVAVDAPEENETLQDFAVKYIGQRTFDPFTPAECPISACIGIKGVQPEQFKENGGEHWQIIAFARDQPEFPGLLFEIPHDLPKPDKSAGITYYRPSQVQQRIPGKLYYLVMLDTASSIEEPALKDYEFFLQNMTVE